MGFRCFSLICVFLFVHLVHAGEIGRSRAELKALEQKIAILQDSLNSNLDQEKSLTAELDRIERDLSRLRTATKENKAESTRLKKELQLLESEFEALVQAGVIGERPIGV